MAINRTAMIQPSFSNPTQPVRIQRFRPSAQAIAPLLLRIENEYREMPGLKLTEPQARRLWNLDGHTCRVVLSALLQQRFLRRTASGAYIRATD